MDFFKKNYETIKSLAIIIGAVAYLHHYMDGRFSAIETRLTKIETVLIMNGMMHPALAKAPQHPDTPSKPDGSF